MEQSSRPPALTPVQLDTSRIIWAGTAAFFLAFVLLLGLRITASTWQAAHPTWLWTSLAGWLLGLAGLTLVRRHRRAGRTQ